MEPLIIFCKAQVVVLETCAREAVSDTGQCLAAPEKRALGGLPGCGTWCVACRVLRRKQTSGSLLEDRRRLVPLHLSADQRLDLE